MQLAQQLLLLSLPTATPTTTATDTDATTLSHTRIPPELKSAILSQIPKTLALLACIPEHKRVARFPASALSPSLSPSPALSPLLHAQWSLSLHVSNRIPEAVSCNLFYHGRLFQREIRERDRLGCVKYILTGVFASFGLGKSPVLDDGDPAHLGFGGFGWAEQHIHKARPARLSVWVFFSVICDFLFWRRFLVSSLSSAYHVAVPRSFLSLSLRRSLCMFLPLLSARSLTHPQTLTHTPRTRIGGWFGRRVAFGQRYGQILRSAEIFLDTLSVTRVWFFICPLPFLFPLC